MTLLATSPSGNPLLALYSTEKAVEAAQARVFVNGQHDEADKRSEVRKAILDEEMAVSEVKRDAKGITIRWADPRQIPEGPHAGEWCIVIPADEARRYQRDPRTGDVTDRPAPEFSGVEIVESDPAWWAEGE